MQKTKRVNQSRNQKGKGSSKAKDSEDDLREYRPLARANMDIIQWQNPRVRDPLPQRFRTVFTFAFEGHVAAGTGTQRWYIRGNGMLTPANGGGWTNASPNTTTTNPTGLTRLFNYESYQLYKVYGSRISVQFSPQAQVDSIDLSVTPSFASSQPGTYQQAMGQQFTRDKLITEGTPISSQTVVNKITTHRLYGVRRQAVEDDLSGRMAGDLTTYPTNPWYWVVNWEPANSAITINLLPYRVLVQYDVELYGDSTADNVIALHRMGRNEDASMPSCELLKRYTAARAAELATAK